MLDDVIKGPKAEAIAQNTTASLLLERITIDYLQRRKGRARKS